MNLLRDLQTDLAERLRSCPEFAHVNVLVVSGNGGRAVESIRDELERALTGLLEVNGRSGIGVIIPMPQVRIENGMENVPGPQITLSCAVQIVENEDINRGDSGVGTTAEALAFTVLTLGHLWQPGSGVILLADERAIEPAELDAELSGTLAYQVNFKAPMSTRPLDKVLTPQLSVSAGVLTLSGVIGATHVVTLDGSYPRPGTPSALVYAAPYAVAENTRIRAASYLPDAAGSDIAEHTT